jgi:hypothetical protein
MITTFMAANELHAVYVIQREGMTKIHAKGFCLVEENAGPGVYQVPDWAFDGRPMYGEIPVCAKCAGTVTAMKVPPP